jgi:hypothetical protein
LSSNLPTIAVIPVPVDLGESGTDMGIDMGTDVGIDMGTDVGTCMGM